MDNEILELLVRESPFFHSPIHGIKHWRTVERNGLYLSRFTGADEGVISHFAYFHDCMRENEQIDPGHGLRGAEFAEAHRDSIRLDELQFHQLFEACKHHTDGKPTTCETISSCWDADRLDIGRVGFEVDPYYLASEEAKRIARCKDFGSLGEQIE